ncbi:MAG: MGH1-like glycoside hydrolase domain-containing protein [bacterium]
MTSLAASAEAVLRSNDVGGAYTRPSGRLYPHQWNWDSAFISIGWAHVDWDRAVREIDSLLAGQWTNGMLPHIRFNPHADDYAPGPEWWPDVPVRTAGERTSGISQPLVLPTAVHVVGLLQPDGGRRLRWWSRIFDGLRDAVGFFPSHRTLPGSPLIVLVHPWESGLDNSPRWDDVVRLDYRPSRPFRRVDTTIVDPTERPRQGDYDLYMYLVELIARHGYEIRAYLAESPFAVYDAMFNAIWYRAAVDLNHIAAALGQPPVVAPSALADFRDAFASLLWNPAEELFLDFDLNARRQIPAVTAAGLSALYGGLVDAERGAMMLARYVSRSAGCRLLPSVPPDQAAFEPARYHRGPVWVQANWLVARGLDDLGLHADARALADATVSLVRANGFHEYFDARTGHGAGDGRFSWTAALTLDLIRRPIA